MNQQQGSPSPEQRRQILMFTPGLLIGAALCLRAVLRGNSVGWPGLIILGGLLVALMLHLLPIGSKSATAVRRAAVVIFIVAAITGGALFVVVTAGRLTQ